LPVGSPVSGLERRSIHARWAEDAAACVIQIPFVVKDSSRVSHPRVESGSGIRRENVKRCRFNSLPYRPFNCPVKYGGIVFVHAEDKASVDHDAMVMQASNGGSIVAAQILKFALLFEIGRVGRLEPYEKTSQSARYGFFQ